MALKIVPRTPKAINVAISALTDSITVISFCEKHKAKLRISQQGTGGHLFSIIGPNGRLLSPMYSSGFGLLQALFLMEECSEPADIREKL